jgi:hypothetical protein
MPNDHSGEFAVSIITVDPDDGGSKLHRNVSIILSNSTALHPLKICLYFVTVDRGSNLLRAWSQTGVNFFNFYAWSCSVLCGQSYFHAPS